MNLNEKKDEDLRNNGKLGKGFLYENLEIQKKTPSLNSLLFKTERTISAVYIEDFPVLR